MMTTLRSRGFIISVILISLIGLFILYGAGVGHSDSPPYSEEQIFTDPDAHVGEEFELSGEVTATDPVTIEITHDDKTTEITIINAPSAQTGEQLTLLGTLTDEATIHADRDRSFTRESWELQYMYVISVIGASFVGLRIINEWQFNLQQLQFQPRSETLYQQYMNTGD